MIDGEALFVIINPAKLGGIIKKLMNGEDNFLKPDKAEKSGQEDIHPADLVKKEIEKLDERSKNESRLKWLRENVAPYDEEDEAKILKLLKDLGRGEVYEDYENMPEPTVELNNDLEPKFDEERPMAEMSDQEITDEIKYREAILVKYGDFNDLSEALETVEAMPGSEELSDEDAAVKAEELIKKKLDATRLEKARKEIEEMLGGKS
jgi:hypothetical protein